MILFIAAAPRGASVLALGEECAAIQRSLAMTPGRDRVRIESRWAVTIDELMRHLTEIDPTIVHISCHGAGRDGLFLQDDHGRPQAITARALAMMLEVAAPRVRAVVLNACHSFVQAAALRRTFDCVVAMNGAIDDDAARAFAVQFYAAIGSYRSLGNAVARGAAALAARQLPDAALPRCLPRPGVDADRIVLVPAPRPRRRARRSRVAAHE